LKGYIKMNHKKKIDNFRKLNTIMDYFLNPHFDQVSTKREKEIVKEHFKHLNK
jgi:hypothetical protein